MSKLFSDCKTDEEKANFFLSGQGYATGVVAHVIQNDVAMAYQRCAEYKKELQHWGKLKVGDMRVLDGETWTCTDPDIDRWICDEQQHQDTATVALRMQKDEIESLKERLSRYEHRHEGSVAWMHLGKPSLEKQRESDQPLYVAPQPAEPEAHSIGYIEDGKAILTHGFGPDGSRWANGTRIYAEPVVKQTSLQGIIRGIESMRKSAEIDLVNTKDDYFRGLADVCTQTLGILQRLDSQIFK